ATLAVLLAWKEFKLLSFDPEFMAVQGWPVRWLDILLTTLIVVAIVIGLQTVGVVLMSALLVAPAAAARQWSNQLGPVAALAALGGALSGIGGAVLSGTIPRLSTGPTIVLVASALVLLSLLLAPARGLLWEHLRHLRQHREVRVAQVLVGLYRLASEHADPTYPHDIATLDAVGLHAAGNTIGQLERRGWARRANGKWGLTARGIDKARALEAGGAL
ncbi:metal ABC transporter permease, partial [bacterium]|nr:metal ABC transporter permease [bacterium]